MIFLYIFGLAIAFFLGMVIAAMMTANHPRSQREKSAYVTRLEADLIGAREAAEYWFRNHRLVVISEAKKISALKRINELCRKCDLISIAEICKEAMSSENIDDVSDADLLNWLQDNAMVDFSFDDCTFKFPVPITVMHGTVREIIAMAMQGDETFDRENELDHPTLRESLDTTQQWATRYTKVSNG